VLLISFGQGSSDPCYEGLYEFFWRGYLFSGLF
jgi:hypothetical protein